MVKRKGGEDCYLILGDGGEAEKWCFRRPERRRETLATLLTFPGIFVLGYIRVLMMMLDFA